MEELAQEYGVSKEYIQYHERKELTLETPWNYTQAGGESCW